MLQGWDVILKIGELRRLARKWQKILKIQDWRIEVRFVDLEEMCAISGKKNLKAGFVLKQSFTRIAVVVVLHERFWKREDDCISYLEPRCSDREIEMTLIHELIHVVLSEYEGDVVLEEQAVDAIAGALMEMKYS